MTKGFVHIKTVAEKVLTKITERSDTLWDRGFVHGEAEITTGFAALDHELGGLYPGGLYIVAGRAGMGKTAFALHTVLGTLQNAKKPVYYFSNYLTAEELLLHLISIIAGIEGYSMRRGLLSESQWEAAGKALAIIADTELYVSHTLFPEASDIAGFIREEVRDGLVVIDGIQDVCYGGNRPFNQRIMDMTQIAAVSRELKLAASDAGVPLLITSQLTRALESRKDKRPNLCDLDSTVGILLSDSDGAILLYREAYYMESENEDRAEVILAHNRHGSTATVTVGFDCPTARFYDI